MNKANIISIRSLFSLILEEEKSFYSTILIYGLFIAILNLAIPLSVQLLINSVAYTAMLSPVIVLGLVLLIIVGFSSILTALQFLACEILQCRFFARITAKITTKLLYVNHVEFEKNNQTEFTNYFFETFVIQKTLPKLLTRSFALLLQIFTGLLLVAFYHPVFLLFSLLLILCLYLIWRCYYVDALISKFESGSKKYEMAGWLEDIARNYIFFKSNQAKEYAIKRTNQITGSYLLARKKHFKYLFSQVILALILYSFASSILLMIGGYLVLKGQLSMGQLVASELVLSASFYGVYQLGKDLDDFYGLTAACEKLQNFYKISNQENGNFLLGNQPISYIFQKVIDEFLGQKFIFDLKLESGKNYFISGNNSTMAKIFIELISGLRKPKLGNLFINKLSVRDVNLEDLNSKVAIIDNSALFEVNIGEYLSLNNESITHKEIIQALEITGLNKKISRFGDFLSLQLIPSGWPLDESEKIMLKLTRALLSKPQVLIITEIIDILAPQIRTQLLRHFIKNHPTMVLYFSNHREDVEGFDNYIFLTPSEVFKFDNLLEIKEFESKIAE